MTISGAPVVSVIIPTYNRGWILAEAIESVMAQTFRDFELIVVDDGSIDNTPEIVAAFKDDIIFVRQKNQGVSAARNRGIHAASGRLLAFLDSDDLWLPEHLELCLKAMDENEDAGGVFTDYYKLYPGDKLVPQRMAGSRYGCFTLKDMVANFSAIGAASNVMVCKRVFDEVGNFNENKDMAGSEDWEMWVRISSKFRFLVLPRETVKLRVHGKNITLRPEKIERSIKAALDSIFSHPQIRPLVWPYRSNAYAEVNTLAAINYYAAGEMKKALYCLKTAFYLRPLHFTNRRFLWTIFRTMLGKGLSRKLRQFKWNLESYSQ